MTLTILDELKRLLQDLLGDGLSRIVLFGSRARGDYEDGSDIDVAVLLRESTPTLKRKVLDEVARLELKYDTPLSILVLSEGEFANLRQRERRIALDIEKEGIAL